VCCLAPGLQAYYLPLALPVEAAATQPLPGRLGRPLAASDADDAALGTRHKRARLEGPAERPVGVSVSRLVGYPVNGWVVEPLTTEGERYSAEAGLPYAAVEAVAGVAGVAAERLQAANQPFNLFVSDGGRRVFVLPQCYAERQAAYEVPEELLECGVNPAAFEIAGHLPLKRAEDYAGADEAWAARLLAAVSLPEEPFTALAELCFGP
jgi:GDP-L-galactose phosphorylase